MWQNFKKVFSKEPPKFCFGGSQGISNVNQGVSDPLFFTTLPYIEKMSSDILPHPRTEVANQDVFEVGGCKFRGACVEPVYTWEIILYVVCAVGLFLFLLLGGDF